MWLQKGDPSIPALVFLHAVWGTPIGASIMRHLPRDRPIISLQAPELVRDCPVSNLVGRAASYRKLLVDELQGHNQTIHLVGYSFSGALSFELALCLKDSALCCGSLCMIDPVPYCSQPESTMSHLMRRAQCYDLFLAGMLRKNAICTTAVTSGDIACVSDLESYALSTTSKHIARELSRMVDTMLTLSAELSTRDFAPTREMYSGPCAFLKAKPEFFEAVGYDSVQHPDGIYGWRHPLCSPDLEAIHLDSSHIDCITHEESVRKIAATLVSLLDETEEIELQVAHASKPSAQTDSPRPTACEASGSGQGQDNTFDNLGQQGGAGPRSD